MPLVDLTPRVPVTLAIAEGATTPNPGTTGAVARSSTTGTLMAWTGTAWRSLYLNTANAANLPAVAAEPATPAAGNVLLYGREVAPDYTTLKMLRPSGVDTPLQDALLFNSFQRHVANNTAILGVGCAAPTLVGTASAQARASGTAKSQVFRVRYTSAATAAALTTWIQPSNNNRPLFRGAVNGEGGFRYLLRFALTTLVAGNRGFWGLAASTAAATNVDPLTVAAPARVGLGFNANTGNWFLIRSDGTTAANQDLGANFPLNGTDLIELLLVCRPHNGTAAGNIGYRVRRYTTASNAPANETTGTLTSNLPAATTFLHPWFFMTNNATAASVAWDFAYDGNESDW